MNTTATGNSKVITKKSAPTLWAMTSLSFTLVTAPMEQTPLTPYNTYIRVQKPTMAMMMETIHTVAEWAVLTAFTDGTIHTSTTIGTAPIGIHGTDGIPLGVTPTPGVDGMILGSMDTMVGDIPIMLGVADGMARHMVLYIVTMQVRQEHTTVHEAIS